MAIVFVILAVFAVVIVIAVLERHRRKKKKTWRGWLNKVTGQPKEASNIEDRQTEVDMSPIPTEEGNREETSGSLE